MDLKSILAKLGLGNSGWAEDVQQEGVRPDYGLSTTTGIARARPEAQGGFAPGEAAVEDVRDSLGDVFLAGLGMVPGGVLAKSGPTARGSRVRWTRRAGGWEPRTGERGGADTGGLDLFNEARFTKMVERKYPGARILSAPSPLSGQRRDVELRLPDGRVVKTFVSNFD